MYVCVFVYIYIYIYIYLYIYIYYNDHFCSAEINYACMHTNKRIVQHRDTDTLTNHAHTHVYYAELHDKFTGDPIQRKQPIDAEPAYVG
jgi:hypothetical protein